jgi:hypothetical protein
MSLAEETKTDVAELTVIDPNLEVKMILESLVSYECKTTLNIQLDAKTQSIINKVLKVSPEFLTEIETVFIEIVKDNKIDSNDIPNLITIVQKLYELIYKAKDIHLDSEKTAEACGTLLKFIVRSLVEERKVKIDEENKVAFFALTDKLIDSCISLLNFPKLVKGSGCLKKIFRV